jgi:ABC-type Mn2+/Zn2+ transport system ATPase subunit
MQNYVVKLESEVFKSFLCQKAANSLDIDSEKKAKHELSVQADLKTPFNVGLIVGSSGSGKTTLAKQIFGKECFDIEIDKSLPIIEQFPAKYSYDEISNFLCSMGLTSVPCWIRPFYTLSNGQKARAEAALSLARADKNVTAIDEWTSVVDRTVAKVMSHCIAKNVRRNDLKIVLNSCHYDTIEWLNPDWIIDCNNQTYTDRRSMVDAFERTDRLRFNIREVSRNTWKTFSKYHYLSDRLPSGKIYTFGIFEGKNQIGFQCFAAYIIGNHTTYFSNRTVIHPDYCGFGLGIKLINETSKIMSEMGFIIKAKFSSLVIHNSMLKSKMWKLSKISKDIKPDSFTESRKSRNRTVRSKVKCYHYNFIG